MNPLLPELNKVVDFKNINQQHVKDATNDSITLARRDLETIYVVANNERTFDNTMLALDNIHNSLDSVSEVITLLAYTHPDDEIRNECLSSAAVLGKFSNEISLSEELYTAAKNYAKSEEALGLEGARRKFLKETLEEFERNGFALSKEKRAKLKVMQDKISDLGIEFDANIGSYEDFLIVTEEQIDGLPDDYKKTHRQDDGTYKIGMEYPSYIPFMKYSYSDKARTELAKKFKNIASDKNLDILKQILIERQKMAILLGYKTYAEYRTEDRMAKTPDNVWKFENKLMEKVRVKAERDYEELLDIKRKLKGDPSINIIEPWEAAYYDNILVKEKYELDNQKLKEYFELNNVMEGLFKITQHLYGISFKEVKKPSVWNDEVRFFELRENDRLIARFYLDLYPRKNKYNHAALFGMISGKQVGDVYQAPTASLVCNFTKATDTSPALMLHSDVETFFHEFGHLMHDLLTKAELTSQSGTSVARDFVEMPSQIFEHWAWDYEALKIFARHYKTGEILPKELHSKMLTAKNVGSGLQTLQQIFYGILDMTYHDRYDTDGKKDTTDVVKELQNEITFYRYQEGTHFEAGFGHLVGYAAGYYSYLWAKVFSEDMFSVFGKNGVMDKNTGMKLRQIVLERGSTINEMEIVKEFLGREPNDEAFLKSIGL